MFDSYNRAITYLRISVTDRCNLRCNYCMPAEGIQWLPQDKILSYEEIVEVVKEAIPLGITKVRLTGGEPLVRKDIVSLVQALASLEGLQQLSMTTNGTFLTTLAKPLKQAGLQTLNVSLDTLNAERFTQLTRGGKLQEVLDGLQAARDAGFETIKLNCVLWKNDSEQDIKSLQTFAKSNQLQLRFIHQMNLTTGEFSVVEGGDAGNCARCNRIRLTSTGILKSCLFSEGGYDIREQGIAQALRLAITNKPACGTYNHSETFNQLGG